MFGTEHMSNRFLAGLAPPDRNALLPLLRTVLLAPKTVLHATGDSIRAAYFPHEGIISLLVDLSSGEMIEAASIGRDGMIGGPSAVAGAIAPNRAVVQVRSIASVTDISHVCQLASKSATFRARLVLHEQFICAQAQQHSACNAVHPVEARLATWLLRCRDLTGPDEMDVTQEFVAEVLGVRRPSISIAAQTLQKAGIIEYRRGHIRVLDVEALSDSACECYEVINTFSERLLGQSPLRGIARSAKFQFSALR